MKVEDFSKEDMERVLDWLRENGKSPSTLLYTARTFSALFTYAIEQKWIEINPVKGVKLPSKANARIHKPVTLTAAQLRVLIETAPENMHGGLILGSPKSNAGYRTIKIPPACQEVVSHALREPLGDDPRLFVKSSHPQG